MPSTERLIVMSTERNVNDLSQWAAWMLINMISFVERGYTKTRQIKAIADRLDEKLMGIGEIVAYHEWGSVFTPDKGKDHRPTSACRRTRADARAPEAADPPKMNFRRSAAQPRHRWAANHGRSYLMLRSDHRLETRWRHDSK